MRSISTTIYVYNEADVFLVNASRSRYLTHFNFKVEIRDKAGSSSKKHLIAI